MGTDGDDATAVAAALDDDDIDADDEVVDDDVANVGCADDAPSFDAICADG
jgi:hypothetical protein